MSTALVRRPSSRLADGLVTHIERQPVSIDRALAEWDSYCAALAANGWTVVEVAPADECADAVFIEDAVVVFDDLAVVTRPGAPSRRAETAGAEIAVREAGLDVAHITAPGTLDGGDVLKIDREVYVGVGGRTTDHAVAQLDDLLTARGWRVHPVEVTKVLHLKSAVTALPDGTVIGYPPLVDHVDSFESFLAVPESDGAHVVLLGGDRLLMSASAPRTAAILQARGYHPVIVEIGEFEKLEGCVTCLSVRLRDR